MKETQECPQIPPLSHPLYPPASGSGISLALELFYLLVSIGSFAIQSALISSMMYCTLQLFSLYFLFPLLIYSPHYNQNDF